MCVCVLHCGYSRSSGLSVFGLDIRVSRCWESTVAAYIVTMAPGMLSTQGEESVEMGFGRNRQSLETWSRISNLRPVRTSLPGNACKKPKDFSAVKKLTLDGSLSVEEDAMKGSGCETPKSNEHRIPYVNVDFCPPAPKKPRGRSRLALACALESQDASMGQDLSLAPCYLF